MDDSLEQTKPSPRRWQEWLKIAVSLLLFGYLFRQIPLAEAWQQLQHLPLTYALISLAVLILSLTLFAAAWMIILHVVQISVSFRETWEMFFQATFVNNFLSFWGGDVWRSYRMGRATQRMLDATVTVLVSRLVMFATVLGLAGISLWLWAEAAGWPFTLAGMLLTFGLLTAVTLFFIICHRFQGKFAQSESKIGCTFHTLLTIGYQTKTFVGTAVLTLAAQLGTVWAVWWLAAGLGVPVTWWQLLLFLSVMGVALILPISFNGLGLRELGLVYLLQQVGVEPSVALALSLATSITIILASFPGGILLVRDAFAKRS
jgi:uncharacterized membrane protein YbhN (UPF0104 family)